MEGWAAAVGWALKLKGEAAAGEGELGAEEAPRLAPLMLSSQLMLSRRAGSIDELRLNSGVP